MIWKLTVVCSRVCVQVPVLVSVVPDIINFLEADVIDIKGCYDVIDWANASLIIPLAK